MRFLSRYPRTGWTLETVILAWKLEIVLYDGVRSVGQILVSTVALSANNCVAIVRQIRTEDCEETSRGMLPPLNIC
ncbi:hypothetical protein SAMN04487967_1050 [Natronorubrum sediminis]|uniref:Uncharacterized protein n=1 Tax=Natronorubrum sediminis TaxID=640943 RepID=A0A1H6FRJ7_9EURY|nr:hypothetical protein SAMN04487967_1050 [Natronorubrum sediminis]